jgi:hypothetical protein
MKPALYILALTVDGLAVLLLLIVLALGHMATPGVITVWVSFVILALNATAIIVAWRFSSAKADESIVASTFS